MKITPVILSGGSGSRLWPISRSLCPKQFLNFFGNFSLFQQTILRTKNKKLFNDPIIICNEEHRFTVADELQKISIKSKSIILEPFGRNTAPAIAVAAIDAIKKNGDDTIILVMPSDHIIKKEKGFILAIKKSLKAVENGYLVTFGIVPNSAETGYGYIKISDKLFDFENVLKVAEFIEKPNKERALDFVKSKKYLWNGGIFIFKAKTYLENLEKLQNDIFINSKNSYNNAIQDMDFIRLTKNDFEKCQNISIDYAIMEKAKKVATIPIKIGWSDVGSWEAIAKITKKDENKNSLIGDILSLNTKNCYINSNHKMVATLGVKDLIIISLKDVVLVANKKNSQEVKKLFEILKEQKRDECNLHTKVTRPWGSFETLDISNGFKVKRIIVNPKAALSLQMHHHRSEHWVIVAGTALVTCDDKKFILNKDQSTYIPIGKKHRLENQEKTPLEIIEIQTGSYLEENDIVRFDDIYGR